MGVEEPARAASSSWSNIVRPEQQKGPQRQTTAGLVPG